LLLVSSTIAVSVTELPPAELIEGLLASSCMDFAIGVVVVVVVLPDAGAPLPPPQPATSAAAMNVAMNDRNP
jgi:hypothetical protein